MPADDNWTQIKNNLASENVTYSDIRTKLDLSLLQQSPEISSRALTGQQRRTNKKTRQPYKGSGSSSSFKHHTNNNECNYCRKLGYKFVGHNHGQCRRLKEAQSQNNNYLSSGTPSYQDKGKGYVARPPTPGHLDEDLGKDFIAHSPAELSPPGSAFKANTMDP